MRKIAGMALPIYVEDRKSRIQPCYLRSVQSKWTTLSHTSRRVLTRVMILMRFCFNSLYNHDPGYRADLQGSVLSLSIRPPLGSLAQDGSNTGAGTVDRVGRLGGGHLRACWRTQREVQLTSFSSTLRS